MKAKHAELRNRAIEHGGGRCKICGYDKCVAALDFHHLDPSKKEFTPSKGYKKSWTKLKQEIDKCILLCSNCHREVHAGVTQWPECQPSKLFVEGSSPSVRSTSEDPA